MSKLPRIEAEVTFLSEFEGGRAVPPLSLSADKHGSYRPHIVVGDPNQRHAIIKGNEIQEEYLGVAFLAGSDEVEFNRPYSVELGLIYYPEVGYESVVPGATFTIREGPRVVGFGKVKKFLR
jgi:hypothetical protein